MEEKFLRAEGAEEERNSPFRTKRDSSNISGSVSFDLSRLQGKLTLTPSEHLKSRKIIDILFKEGKSVSHNGFTLVYLEHPLHVLYPAQVAFSVPKRNFKRATDRNRIKRLLREAYRLQKFSFYSELIAHERHLAIMWVYKGRNLPDFITVLHEVDFCLNKIMTK
jgi:ribonuclease P protein component